MAEDTAPVAAGSIQAVNKGTIHRICSGQVVLTLSTAIKELIENSLDANAKNIDIQLVNYGAQSIQISDDGCGIEENNFQALTLRHHTSKLKEFEDLTTLDTFGFRGEALSSLCALSSLSVITRHLSPQVKSGTHLRYDHTGTLLSREPTSRAVGTTLLLEDLFTPLPVRRAEFMRNLKKEFAKMVQVVQAYCLVSPGVRISCSNDSGSGRAGKKLVLSSMGKNTLKENITDIFGLKQIQSLVPLQPSQADEEDLAFYDLLPSSCKDVRIDVSGYISSCVHGKGRASSDRQFYFVNGRPCDPAKLTRLVNELYRQHNRNQSPFVCVMVNVDSQAVDINVTPDKRQILLHHDKLLLATTRTVLKRAFSSLTATYELSQPTFAPTSAQEMGTNAQSSQTRLRSLRTQFSITDTGDENVSFANVYRKRAEPNVKQTMLRPIGSMRISSPEEVVDKIKDCNTESCVVASPPKEAASHHRKQVEIVVDLEDTKRADRRATRLRFSLSVLLDRMKRRSNHCSKESSVDSASFRKFLSGITPAENKAAESELTRNISKTDFRHMNILGQFNLGFIITRLNEDLFIVDQHASDEKFNFERLENSQLLEAQDMVVPQPLGLSVIQEDLLREHMDVFTRNGFEFEFNPQGGAKLKRIPHYRNWIFGREDIDELLFLISESLQGESMTQLRPSRVREMLASRACRTSVMIGKALSKCDMRRLIDNMASMEQPWNCPHGRPTMRHLINLRMLPA